MLLQLLGRHLHGDPRVRPLRELGQHLLADPPDHAARQAAPQRVEVSGAADLGLPVHRSRVPGHESPLRLERQIVHPLDDRRQLVDPVLHRRSRQDQAIRGVELLHGQRGLGRPVLDPLSLIQNDEVRVPVADHVQVADQLLVVGHQESAAAFAECRAPLPGVAIDHGGGGVGEELPLAKPLRLERGGDDQEPSAETAGVPEGVARGDRLRGLPETHVVGEQEPSTREEPLDSFSLVRVESLLQGPERLLQAAQVHGALEGALGATPVLLKHRVEGGFAVSIPERFEETVH